MQFQCYFDQEIVGEEPSLGFAILFIHFFLLFYLPGVIRILMAELSDLTGFAAYISHFHLALHNFCQNFSDKFFDWLPLNCLHCFTAEITNPWSRDENQQQTQPTYDAETGNRTRPHWWEARALTTARSLLPQQ